VGFVEETVSERGVASASVVEALHIGDDVASGPFVSGVDPAVNALTLQMTCPWRTVEQVELATLEWVWWFNNQSLHSELD
jgi:hypothetical protein